MCELIKSTKLFQNRYLKLSSYSKAQLVKNIAL